MPLSEDVKMDVSRHLGYEVQGLYQLSPAGGSNAYGNAGFRMFGAYGDLLFKENWLRPIEEAKLTGLATGWISFSGIEPNAGDTLTVTLTAPSVLSSPVVASVTVPARLPGQTPYSLNTLAQALATAFGSQTAFVAGGFQALADYGQNPLSQTQKVAVPICSINGPAGLDSFTLSIIMTGAIAPYVTPTASPVAPFAAFRLGGVENRIFGFVPILNFLEGAHAGEAIFLSAIEANGTRFRGDVLEQREHQYEIWRKKLALFMRIPVRLNVDDRPQVSW